ncbi:MAG: DUF2510 domain-containing protein [Mycobacterium sp.]
MGENLPPPAVPAGWYSHPDGAARYFDGSEWTDKAAPRISKGILAWLIVAYSVAAAGLIYALWPYGTWPL